MKERWVRGRTAAEVVTCILWFASDGARTARCGKDGRVKKALAVPRQKIKATVKLYRLSTVSTLYATPRRVGEPGTVAHLQFLETRRFTRSDRLSVTTRVVGQAFFALSVYACFW